jgi:hypothetical protein
MLRAGVSLPALKDLLGHKDIRMTLSYVQVTQNDLQEQYRQARQSVDSKYAIPGLSCILNENCKTVMGIEAICSTLDCLIQSVEIYTRHLDNSLVMHDLQCLVRRLKNILKKMNDLGKVTE